ncbi:MAG: DUF2283 domain-containing protein [Bacteroidetes bacterium]|nr:DUF2283 domain-containing protein [Bacteroidota bacterium]
MKVKYNKEADVLYIQLSDARIAESDEERKGIVLDYDPDGRIVGIEILSASKNLPQPTKVEYEIT